MHSRGMISEGGEGNEERGREEPGGSNTETDKLLRGGMPRDKTVHDDVWRTETRSSGGGGG